MMLADFPSWITAISTAVGATAAVVAGVFAYRAFSQQELQVRLLQGQESDRRLDRRRSQAALVFAIVESTSTFEGGTSNVHVAVTNLSQEPIWQCAVIVKSDWGLRPKARQREWVNVLAPGETRRVSLTIRLTDMAPFATPAPPAELTFRDASGVNWRRTDEGQIEEITGDRPPEPIWDWDDEVDGG